MFARHLMCTTPIVQTGPAWQTSDLGIYNASTVYDLDRANRIYYRTTGTRPTFTGVAGRVGSDGRILLVTGAAASGSPSRISLFATDKAGPVGDPVQDWAVPTGGILWNLYGRAAATYVQSGGGFVHPVISYAIRHTDLATGQSYAMGTVVAYGGTSLTGLTNRDDFYVLTGSYRGTFLGYKQGNSASWFTTVPASGGRAARATIPRQVYDEKGIAAFWRMRAAAGPELVHLLP
ncbi:hypothetical protein [Methylobacterium sp. 37f]|uniref:hypothetical protein n=1 Tax=Methylobacterium sp. 37f TaxID=2817058 RepID=UPI001FFC9C61|nr:hypothetical protein [Methylobacterium sp. 37f]MCK2055301.1 hypothetical protein [Methylobacterium sp. 37f]